MFSSGVDSLLDASACAGTEGLYPGQPESSSTEPMAVSEPNLGLEAKPDVSTPVLTTRGDGLSAEHCRTSGAENLCQKPEDLGDGLQGVSGAAESLNGVVLKAGDLEVEEKKKETDLRKLDCSQEDHEGAVSVEQFHAECCGERQSEQEDPHLIHHEAKPLGACCTERAGSLKNTEENQANVQVTAVTLPKLTEEVQGMKADGTRLFRKAGYRNARVSKGLPPESSECPDVATVVDRAGVAESSMLGFLEHLKVMDLESATEHPQETNEYKGLKGHTALPLRTGGDIVSVLEAREEKLPRQSPVNEFSTSLANCQTDQQGEENNGHDFCPVPKHNEPHSLSPVESCRALPTESSEALYLILKSTSYLDFRNMPLENNSTAVHGILSENPRKCLPQNIQSQAQYDHGTGFVENLTSRSVPEKQISVVRSKELVSADTDHKEVSASVGKSCGSEFEEAAEVWRKTAGDNTEVCSRPEAQEGASSEHCHSSVFSSVASSPEEFSKEQVKIVPSEGDKLTEDKGQFSDSELHKDNAKENSLLLERSTTASHEIGQADIGVCDTSSCLDLSTKLEQYSPEAQLLGKKCKSNTASEELAGSLAEAPEASGNDCVPTGKKRNLLYTLNVTLPPVAQKSRELHCHEKFSGKESFGASGTTGEQVTEIVSHKDKFKSSVGSRTFYNSDMTGRIFQKNMKSSSGNAESVPSGLETEHRDRWNGRNQTVQGKCPAASMSCVFPGAAGVAAVPSSHPDVEVTKRSGENARLEGEASAGYHSNKAATCPEAHSPLAWGSLPCEDDWGNSPVDGISIAQHTFCSAHTAEEAVPALETDGISKKNMEIWKQCDLCKVKDSSEIVCDRDEAKDQISRCALQAEEFDKAMTVDSPKAPEGHQKNKTSEQLSVRCLNKKPCVRCLLLSTMNTQTPRASQAENTLCPMENQCLACQRELDGPVADSKQHLGSLNNPPNTGLQTTAASVEETKIPVCSGPSEEVLSKPGGSLPLIAHKYPRENHFPSTPKENVADLDSLLGVRNEDCSGYVGSTTDLTEEKTIKLLDREDGSEREDKGTLEESFSDSKNCPQHACFLKGTKEETELVSAGNKMQQSLPKRRQLVEDQENTVSAQFWPFSPAHESLSHKPENMDELSEAENTKRLRIKSVLNNSCLQLTLESGKETGPQKGPSHDVKLNIQESCTGTQVDSETLSPQNFVIPLPQKEELCGSSETTQIEHCDLSSAKVCSRDSSVAKAVTVSAKRKSSNTEIPSVESEVATGFLNGAKSSRIAAQSKESLRNEGHSMATAKGMDETSQKSARCGKKCKSACIEKKKGRQVAPRKKVLTDSFRDGEDCLGALLEDPKESGSKTVPLSTENCGKEEIPITNLNNLSKKRQNAPKLPNVAGTRLLLEAAHDCQAEGASSETSPDLQHNTAPTFYPHVQSDSGREPSPGRVACSEVCVPYKSNAQSTGDVQGVTEVQDTTPIHSVSKRNEALASEGLHQKEKHQVCKRQRKCKKVELAVSDKAQEEQKSEDQEKAKITLQPSVLQRARLLRSSSNELVTSRNTKLEGPSEDIFAVRNSENKLSSTLQEVKRPKITTDISSVFLKTQDSEMENLNLNLGCDGIPGAFGTTNKLRGPLPLKIQPGRTCKKVPTSYQLKTVRKSKNVTSSPFFEVPPEVLPKQEKTLVNPVCFPCQNPPVEREAARRCVHVPRQRAKRCSLLNSLKFRKCTKEPALLSKLSAMASKLLAPAKSIHGLEPLPCSSEILPVGERYSQRRSKNLLEAFSCINRNLHSRWADSWCTKMFSFKPLALYPLESTKIPFSESSHKPPASFLDTPVFPISFHIKLDSSPSTELTRITVQHSGQHRPVLGDMAALPSKWTLSFLLSQSCSDRTALKEDSSLNDELHSSLSPTTPRAAALHPYRGRNERRGGYSMLGLHTVLALSSPGCYRIWTRRRNLTSHIPTIQRLCISQFTQGLKGAVSPAPLSDDLVSSLPYSLGRVLSIWSQHGPAARPSAVPALQSSPCKWQPSVGIESSYALLPQLPEQSMEALQTAGHEIHLETLFPLPLPKSCSLPESLPPTPRVSASELQAEAAEAAASVPACLRSQADTELKKAELEKRPNKVSQIRIRKTVPKPDPNLTPMGLPKQKRLKKKEFSLEEIYTNKNYKSPPSARSLETIFEEPMEKNGHLISVSQQKRKRILEFQDFTLPRKRKSRGKMKAVGSFTRGKKAALQSAELDALLSQKLVDLEAFFAKEAEQEQASDI